MLQTWEALTFLHWRYKPEQIRHLIPRELSIDLFDGSAWVTLTPFVVSNLRVPSLPAIPWLSRFPETNVRSYVRGPDGEPGIWFFTLDAARLAAVAGARLTYRLPYRWASMRVDAGPDRTAYSSRRHVGFRAAHVRMLVAVGQSLRAGDLENFLTARFRLYTRAAGRMAFADIEHPPWPLQEAELIQLDQTIVPASGLPPPRTEPLVHYSARVDVRVGRLRSGS